MNLIIIPAHEHSFYYRPDSTLIRDLSVYYRPDEVASLQAAPALAIRLRRPGKAIAPRFAERYWDTYGFGLILHPELQTAITGHREFLQNTLDYTTLVPLKSKAITDFEQETPARFFRNQSELPLTLPSPAQWADQLAHISNYCSLRIGDLLLLELSNPVKIAAGDRLQAEWQTEKLWDFEIR